MDSPASKPLGRNDHCHCQSGKKYKQCCLEKDEAAARQVREKARAEAAAAAPAEEAPVKDTRPEGKHRHGRDESGHFTGQGGAAGNRGFQKATGTPRKVGGG